MQKLALDEIMKETNKIEWEKPLFLKNKIKKGTLLK
jgi:hypothetical protein